jgi:signal transduction histidine kinase
MSERPDWRAALHERRCAWRIRHRERHAQYRRQGLFRRSHRLYWRIWLAVLATLAAVAIGLAVAWRLMIEPAGMDIALATPDGRSLGQAQMRVLDGDARGVRRYTVRMPDGSQVIATPDFRHRHSPLGAVGIIALVALAVGVGAFPVARRLTRRLEELQSGVEAWGAGDLSARVEVRGCDEVARLADSFNHSADRIEALVHSHKSLLANASHELRSPLARLRMAIEMLHGDADPALRRELARDIAELDQLIDEILLASRLDSHSRSSETMEEVDLTALVAEECARQGADFDGVLVTLNASHRLLTRLVRNLLENARRYGAGTPIEVRLTRQPDGAIGLTVCDRGPGVPEAERERIFEPFYRVSGARESAGGVGLGLSLVRQIARQHGGEVVCEAREGGGSCFRLRLPVGA